MMVRVTFDHRDDPIGTPNYKVTTVRVARLGGRYAHVLDESIETRHDDAAGKAWLRGRFN